MPDSTSAICGIYRITGPEAVYIGSSDVIPRRFKQHLSGLRGNRHHNYRLQAAWNLHGEDAFTFEAIEAVTDVKDLTATEQRLLDAAMVTGPVYNIALDVITPARGLIHTAEARLKMSVAIKASMTPEMLAAKSERIRGDQNPSSKLTDGLVMEICRRLAAGDHPVVVADESDVCESTVYQIRSGRIWTHIVTPEIVATMTSVRQNGWDKRSVTEELREHGRALGKANAGRPASALSREMTSLRSRGEGNPQAKVTEVQAAQIKGLLAAGALCKDIALTFDLTPNSVSRINTGETWAQTEAAPVSPVWGYLTELPKRAAATAEHRANLSAALKGKPKTAEHRANLWANREVSPEFRAQMALNGAANKGKTKSAETRAKMSAAQSAGRPVLTEGIVREIKQLLAAGEMSGSAIGRKFGITPGAVSSIKQGRNWAHVTI